MPTVTMLKSGSCALCCEMARLAARKDTIERFERVVAENVRQTGRGERTLVTISKDVLHMEQAYLI
jgi:hypothetical protein